MSTNKLFSVVGTSKLDGETKVRFANDIMRVKVLAKHGHEDIMMIALDDAMTKLDAVNFMAGLQEFQELEQQDAIQEFLAKNTPTEKKVRAPKAVKAPKAVEAEDTAELDEADEIAAAELVVAELEATATSQADALEDVF